MKPRLLFVDDEPRILQGLRRSLRRKRDDWEMAFAADGLEALSLVDEWVPDIAVSDMRMPGIDGAELLTGLAQLYPRTIRFVLSGEAEIDQIYRVVGISHQFMLKPCEAELLIGRLERVLALRALVRDEESLTAIARVTSLPTPSVIYDAVQEELGAARPSIDRIAALVAKDVGLTAKVLQLTNSSYFGSAAPVMSPFAAVKRLGLDTIVNLAGRGGFMTRLSEQSYCSEFEAICVRSRADADRARAAALERDHSDDEADEAWTGGMLQAVASLAVIVATGESSNRFGDDDRVANLNAFMQELWGLPRQFVVGAETGAPPVGAETGAPPVGGDNACAVAAGA